MAYTTLTGGSGGGGNYQSGDEWTATIATQVRDNFEDHEAAIGALETATANDAITNAKLANMAQATVKMRASGAGTGDPIDGTPDQLSTVLDAASDPFLRTSAGGGGGLDQLTGDVTAGPGSGSQTATIANDAVTNVKAANMAQSTIKGRAAAAGTGDPTDLTADQASTVLDAATDPFVRTSDLGGGSGDVVGPASSVDGEIVLFDSTTGKLLKRAPGTGFVRATSGVYSAAKLKRTIGITIDGGGSVITTGVKGFVSSQFAGTITKVRVLSTDAAVTSGSIVIDVWKDTYANYPPTVADTITASAKPTLSGATKAEDSTLTGWTTSVTAGDVFGFKVDSVATLTRVTLELTVEE